MHFILFSFCRELKDERANERKIIIHDITHDFIHNQTKEIMINHIAIEKHAEENANTLAKLQESNRRILLLNSQVKNMENNLNQNEKDQEEIHNAIEKRLDKKNENIQSELQRKYWRLSDLEFKPQV